MDLNRNNMDLERFKLLTNAEMHRLTQALGARKKDTKEMLVQRWKDYLETQEVRPLLLLHIETPLM